MRRNAFTGIAMLLCLLGLAVMASSDARAQTKPEAKIRVLILDGFSNHNWKLNTKLLRGLLGPTGLFEVSVSTCPPGNSPEWANWNPDFSKCDVVIQTCNDISQNPKPKWPEPVKKAFAEFVNNGGGALIYHSGNNAFPDWAEYNDIIGIGWRNQNQGKALQMDAEGKITEIPLGTGRGTGHANRAEVLVKRLGDHAIHAGMPREWKSPALEVYYNSRGPAKNIEIISYGQDPQGKQYWPLEWTVTYGKGRVYSSSFGHVWHDENETKQPVDLLAVDEQILIQRAIQWLAKHEITVTVPANFPTAEKVSLSEPIVLPKD
jgi:hypothetical protein